MKYEILVILLLEGKKSDESYRLICEIEGPDVLNKRTARRYFQKFENGQTDLRRQEGSCYWSTNCFCNSSLKEVLGCDEVNSKKRLC